MRKTTTCGVVLTLLLVGALQAQEVRTVAVFRSDDVILAFYEESESLREYRRAEERYEDRVQEIEARIRDYQARRQAALDRGDSRTARSLREDIADLEDELLVLYENWAQDSAEIVNELAGDEFLTRLFNVVAYLAENGGYTLVMDKSALGDALFWLSQSVDITEEVIAELLRRDR
jgi:Skp family chaperone for outer membrane proteins